MMTQFIINNGMGKLEGILQYRAGEYSFDFSPASPAELMLKEGDEGTTSLLIGTLQIELSVETGDLLYVWGYYPNKSWKQQSLPQLPTTPASVRLVVEEALTPGISIPLARAGELATFYDSSTRWICIGDYHAKPTSVHIEFATNTILTIDQRGFQALWLHPDVS